MLEFLHTTPFGRAIYLLIISMLPVIERGGIPMAAVMGMPWFEAFFIWFLGNMIPAPFIILFIRRILQYFKKIRFTAPFIEKFEKHVEHKSKKVLKYEYLGLFIFAATPLPGAGAWTGAAIAAFLNMRFKSAILAISAGILIAGLIITGLSYGFLGILSML